MDKQSWIVVRHKERKIVRRGYETETILSKTVLLIGNLALAHF